MRKLTMEYCNEFVKENYKNIVIVDKDYVSAIHKMEFKCLVDGYVWKAKWNDFRISKGCPECVGCRKDIDIKYVKNKLLDINNNISILSENYIDAHSLLKCKCNIDNYEWNTNWNNLKSGKGCPKCTRSVTHTLDTLKEELYKINPNLELIDDNYINANTPMKCRCKIDGYIWFVSWANLSQGRTCPECKGYMPMGEVDVLNWLESKNIEYKARKTFDGCKYKNTLSYDFYLPSYNTCIEVQGKQHYEPIEFFGGIKAFKSQQIRDKIKKDYCDNNGIYLLEIPYFKNTLDILNLWISDGG